MGKELSEIFFLCGGKGGGGLAKIGGLKSIFFRGPKRFIYLFILGGGQIAKMGGQIAHSYIYMYVCIPSNAIIVYHILV